MKAVWRRPQTVILIAACAAAVIIGSVFFFRHSPSDIGSCAGVETGERYKCWREFILSDITAGNITRALQQLDAFTKESPDFVSTCHTFAHEVGERAYADFESGTQVTPSPDMQICDFGFYHGFMTAFLSRSRDFKQVGSFCASMKAMPVDGILVDSRAACFHGIGHGSVVDRDATEWKKPLEVVQQALATCHAAANSDHDLQKCLGGVYNGMAYGEYAKHMDQKDPFKICRSVAEADSPIDCYANLASVVFNMTAHKTISEAVDLAAAFTPARFLLHAIPTFANMAARESGSGSASASACLRLSQKEREFCIAGYVTGLIQAQPIETKQAAAYDFCSGDLLPQREHEGCFVSSFQTLSDFWTKEKIESSCVAVDDVPSCRAALLSWSARS